jgi:hypothetical protein
MGDDPDDFDDNGTWEKYDLQELLDESRNLVYVEFGEFDSFGRVLATIYIAIVLFIEVIFKHFYNI